MFVSALASVLIAVTPSSAAHVTRLADAPELAADSLSAGRGTEALARLEKASAADPRDPAVLINLGIAYAREGDEVRARAAFEQALACEDVVELDTASGSTTDSRKLARKAIKMLERGEFRTQTMSAGQLTYRD